MGVPDVDDVDEVVVVSREDDVVTCTDEVLVKLTDVVVEEELDGGDTEYRFNP